MAAQETMGKKITAEEKRDAIHIALAPVIANEKIYPGQDIGLVDGNQELAGSNVTKKIGIADPFLTEPILKGERFWMFIYPNTIGGLRHEWEHPSFPKA